MHLKVLLPNQALLDQAVTKVTAEAVDGSFCLLPRHVDFVTGLVAFEDQQQREFFLATDEGVLVKIGPDVLI